LRSVQCGKHVLRLHVKAVDVVEASIEGFGDDRKSPRLETWALHLPLKNRVAYDANAVRIRDGHGTLEESRLLQPCRAGHLAVAIQREPRTEHGIGVVLATRMDDGDASSHRSLSNDETTAARDERRLTDLHAGNVRDGVERTSRAANWNAEIARPRLRLRGDGRGCDCEQRDGGTNDHDLSPHT
jgi:hypothetical protein